MQKGNAQINKKNLTSQFIEIIIFYVNGDTVISY